MSNDDALINRVFSARYKLESLIGEGGMSRVYRARDIRTDKTVALKILKSEYNQDQEFLGRFQREAKAASLMDHHNIVSLLDVGIEDDMRFIVFEYVNGSTLADIIRERGRLPYKTAVPIAVRVLSALQHAHSHEIIHRDIKPQNILINEEGLVKVTDFGIARMANFGTLTKDNMVLGSVHYSSPEQASGLKAEPPSDLYSTGIVLYEMLTGRVPFTGDTSAAVALQQVQATPPPIAELAPETPPAVIAVVMKALEKKPENRFASASDMALALNQAMEGTLNIEDILPPSPGNENDSKHNQNHHHNPISEKKIRSRILLASGLLLLLAGVLFAIFISEFHQVSVPDVLDLSEEQAIQAMEAASLQYETESSFHPSIETGMVINQIPGPEELVNRNTVVKLIISKGPSDQDLLPNVQSMNYETALATLKERGIENTIIVKMVSTQPIDTVIAQSPSAGTEITEGLSVELTISGGSVIIPSVVGMKRTEASAILTEAGLSEGILSYAEVAADQLGTIVSQNPAPGSTAVLGASVMLTLGIESQPYIAEVDLNIPPVADTDRVLRIMLITDGKEYIKYQCTVYASNALEEKIPIKSALSGDQTCRIYLGDELVQELSLNFN